MELALVPAVNKTARLILTIFGAAAIAWAAFVFPVFWSERVIVDVAQAVTAGEAFKPDILEAVEASTEGEKGSALRSSVLSKAAVIRLRQAEDVIRAGDSEHFDQTLEALARIVDNSLENAPSDPFLWLTRFWLENTRGGLLADNLRFLRMSYDLGPYEGWIAVKRCPIALTAFPVLSNDLAERAISEFVDLVRWGIISDAANIAVGPGRPLRSILFPRLKGLKRDQRRAFANLIYRHDLDDVLVPGIALPPVKIPMPVLPPDF
jgi:hypothetical protein